MIETTKQNIVDIEERISYIQPRTNSEYVYSYEYKIELDIVEEQLKLWEEKLKQEEELIRNYESNIKYFDEKYKELFDIMGAGGTRIPLVSAQIIKDIKGSE